MRRGLHAPLAELQAAAGGIDDHVFDVAHAAAAADELELREQRARRHHPPRSCVCAPVPAVNESVSVPRFQVFGPQGSGPYGL